MPTFSANGKHKLQGLISNAVGKLKRAHTNSARRTIEMNFVEKYNALKNAENARYSRELENFHRAIAEMKRGKTKPPRGRPSPASVARRNSLMANIKRAEKVRQTAKSIEKALSARRQQ
jgi:hypothetical protein